MNAVVVILHFHRHPHCIHTNQHLKRYIGRHQLSCQQFIVFAFIYITKHENNNCKSLGNVLFQHLILIDASIRICIIAVIFIYTQIFIHHVYLLYRIAVSMYG